MRWAKHLHTDKENIRDLSFFKWRVEHGSFMPGLHLITLSTAESMQLDIIKATDTKNRLLRKNLPLIVGFAGSYDKAMGIVLDLIDTCYSETGTADVRTYLLKKEELP